MRLLHCSCRVVAALAMTCWLSASYPSAQPAASATPSSFTVFVLGKPIGSEQITVERNAAGRRIVAGGRLGAPLDLIIRQFDAQYDNDWRPVELIVDATWRGQLMKFRTSVSGSDATTDVTLANGETSRHTAPIDLRAVLLPNPFIAAYAGIAARLAGAAPGSTLSVWVPPGAVLVGTVGTSTGERIQTLDRTIQATRTQLTLQAESGVPLGLEIWNDEGGHLLRVSIPAQGVDAVREDLASVSTRRLLITRAGDESVRVPAIGFSLAGTLSKPADAVAPLPAVVLVGGSGSADRDEPIAGMPIFGQLANALADSGFLVLRYDKRGIGQSGGRPESATLTDFSDDLRAVVRFVAGRKDVDRRRLIVVGHGEGGAVGMLAAARDDRIKGLVLMAAIGTTGAELNMEQVRRALDRSTRPAAEKQATIDLQERIQQAVLTGKGWEGIAPVLRQQADVPWFQSFLAFDPARVMRDVDQPLLVIQPMLDSQVAPSHADKLESLARRRKGSIPVDVIRLAGTNHLLAPATTGEVEEYPSLKTREVSPEVASGITAWAKKTFGETPARRN